jgi:hypothetical protein
LVRCGSEAGADTATMENITPPKPAKRALAALDQPAPPADIIGPKRRPISKKVMKAIHLMIAGKAKTITDAAEQVGLPRETLSRNLSRPDVTETMRQLVIKSLASAAGRASAVKIDLMESDNAVVAERASSYVLAMIGIAPQPAAAAVNFNFEVRAGYTIDLTEDRDMKVIPLPTARKIEG